MGVSPSIALADLSQAVNGVAATRNFGQRSIERFFARVRVGARFRRVKLQQQVPGFDAIAVSHGDRRDLAGLQRLDDFGARFGLDLSRRDGIDVKPAKIGPNEKSGEECANRQQRRDRQRGWRSLEKFQRGRKKLPVAAL